MHIAGWSRRTAVCCSVLPAPTTLTSPQIWQRCSRDCGKTPAYRSALPVPASTSSTTPPASKQQYYNILVTLLYQITYAIHIAGKRMKGGPKRRLTYDIKDTQHFKCKLVMCHSHGRLQNTLVKAGHLSYRTSKG